MSMKQIIELLYATNFYRIHKSYIVNFKQIEVIEKHKVVINNFSIPVGNSYRSDFFKFLDKRY